MNKKQLFGAVFLLVATLGIISIARVNLVSAQEAGQEGAGRIGGSGGFGGAGGGGGFGGGGGGGGGGFGFSGRGGVAAYGEYVYVVQQSMLYQYTAYDLKLVKKISLNGARAKGRQPGGGRGGRGGDAGQNGEVGQAGFGFIDGGAEGVAAYGDYVYVLQGETIRKFEADGLKAVKNVQLATAADAE